MYLSGLLHWFASLLFLLSSIAFLVCLFSERAMVTWTFQWLLESPSDHIVCASQAGATVSV